MSRWRPHRALQVERWDYTDYLSSRDPGIAFQATVHLTGTRGQTDPGDSELTAARLVRSYLEKEARRYSVLRRHAAQQDIHAVLQEALPLNAPDLQVLSATVVLMASERAVHAAREIEQAEYECELDEIARRQTRARMAFLREECLTNPADARLYLMLEHNPRLGGPGPYSDPEQLVHEIAKWHDKSRWVTVAKVLTTFIEQLKPEQEEDLLKILRSAMMTLGQHTTAQRLDDVPQPNDR
jgi:hypothetical protein